MKVKAGRAAVALRLAAAAAAGVGAAAEAQALERLPKLLLQAKHLEEPALVDSILTAPAATVAARGAVRHPGIVNVEQREGVAERREQREPRRRRRRRRAVAMPSEL